MKTSAKGLSLSEFFPCHAIDLLALTFIAVFWWSQATVVGSLFDYGLVIQGSYGIEHGIWPHRDYTCSLQALNLLLARAFEIIFGTKYLSLGIANLFLAALTFFCFRTLLREWPVPSGTVVAFCLTAATALQHGALWYNTLGITFFLLLVCVSGKIAAGSGLCWVINFLVIGTLSGMNKLNFHLGALGCAFLIFSDEAFQKRSWKKAGHFAILLFFALISGPLVEIAITGATPSQWYYDIVQVGSYRTNFLEMNFGSLSNLYQLFFGIVFQFYPYQAPWGRGIPIMMGGAFLAIWVFLSRKHWRMAGILLGIYLCSLAIIVTNTDVIVLRACAFACGLLVPALREKTNDRVRRIATAGVIYLGLISLPSVFLHSRLAFEPLTGPFTDGGKLHPYFAGTRIDSKRTLEIEAAQSVLSKIKNGERVFFGPGTNYMYRIFPFVSAQTLPLWYDNGTAYAFDQIPTITKDFYANGFAAIVYNEWGFGLPAQIHESMKGKYLLAEHEAKHLNILFPRDSKVVQ